METIIVLTAITAFIVTNLDDMFILAAFFAHPSFQVRDVVLGQYLGFTILLLVSLLAYFAQFVLSTAWISLLGFFPIAIGIKNLIRLRKSPKEDFDNEIPEKKAEISNKIFAVAIVTVANGGDNLGIYMPLFTAMNPLSLLLMAVTFLIMLGVWCLLGYKMVNNRIIGDKFKKYAHIILPFVMIFIGLMIIMRGWF